MSSLVAFPPSVSTARPGEAPRGSSQELITSPPGRDQPSWSPTGITAIVVSAEDPSTGPTVSPGCAEAGSCGSAGPRLLVCPAFRPTPEGAKASLYAATVPDLSGGSHVVPGQPQPRSS
ncbi:hypothetical protein ABZ917_48160 [Nonomuraea wenchangensis]